MSANKCTKATSTSYMYIYTFNGFDDAPLIRVCIQWWLWSLVCYIWLFGVYSYIPRASDTVRVIGHHRTYARSNIHTHTHKLTVYNKDMENENARRISTSQVLITLRAAYARKISMATRKTAEWVCGKIMTQVPNCLISSLGVQKMSPVEHALRATLCASRLLLLALTCTALPKDVRRTTCGP